MSSKGKLLLAACFALLFVGILLLVLFVDVAAIGPEGTKVGLSSLNKQVHDAVGVHLNWYDITEYLGYLALAVAAAFGALGLWQAISRKGIFRVDRELLILGGLYLIVLAVYVFFEKVIVNYRPVILPDEPGPEASFPSSHTVLAFTIMGSAMMVLGKYVKNSGLRVALWVLCLALLTVIVIGRFYSGVHWLTDITAGMLISGALLSLFAGLKDRLTGEAR